MLTYNQRRFFELLEQCPWLLPYWDKEKREYKPHEIQEAMPAWSSGEQIMAIFFISLWKNKQVEDYHLDVFKAASVLDSSNRQIIADWFADPFYP